MEKKLIVIEGASDGVGKTTQFNLLNQRLISDGIEVVNHHFPTYHTYQGLMVEKYLAGEYGQLSEISPYFVNSLYAVDRAITWITKLKPLYEAGKTIVLDRYTTSSLIYQTALIDGHQAKKDFIKYVIDYEYNRMGIKEPDEVIFLYASFDIINELRKKRINNDGNSHDIHETNQEYLKRVYESAIFVANYLSWHQVKCDDSYQMRTVEDINDDIYRLIKK